MLKVEIVQDELNFFTAKEIRRQVFQIEQGIDEKVDFDGKDDKSEHFLAFCKSEAVGTARVRYISKETAKLERLAVLKNYRKIGVGRKIMDYIINYLRKKGIQNLTLDSQEHAKGFYEEIEFKQKGEVFQEAGIPHVKMYKTL